MNSKEYYDPRPTVYAENYKDNRFYAETHPAKKKNISQFMTSSQIVRALNFNLKNKFIWFM